MLRLIFNFLLVIFFLAGLAIGAILWYLVPGLPDTESLKDIRLQTPLRVYTRDHALIAEFGEKRRKPVRIGQVPPLVTEAFLAAEDDRFYQHPGVDWQGIVRAALHLLRTGSKGQGGSTITMQVARNFFLSREKTYLRKLNEILLALKIERELSKQEILELYLNKIYLGHRAYGIGAAAEVYYGVPINRLTLPQIAMIAGLPKAPSSMNPVTAPARAIERRNYVLGRMRELGYIDQPRFEAARKAPISASLHAQRIEVEAPYVAEMVRTQMVGKYGDDAYTSGFDVITTLDARRQAAAVSAQRQALLAYERRHGYRGPEQQLDLPAGSDQQQWSALLQGFSRVGNLEPALVIDVREKSAVVYTRRQGLLLLEWPGLSWARAYIDTGHRKPAPKTAGEILAQGDIVRVYQTPEEDWVLGQIPAVEGALVSVLPDDGAIQALVGGFDFTRSKFNRVTQARRQPGSNFKPFIYSAALEKGYTPASLINDAPIVFDDPGLENTWRPENYSGKYFGPTRLRRALYKSRNLVSIRLLRAIGVDYAIDYAGRFGFSPDELPHNLSLALGSATLTPLQIVRGYSVFANGGYRIEPYFTAEIRDYRGEIIFSATPYHVCHDCAPQDDSPGTSHATDTPAASEGEPQAPDEAGKFYAPRVIEARNCWLMTSILRDVIRKGTGRKALVLKRHDLSGKTGTTNEQVDAWFSGFNTRLVTTTWVGFDQSRSMGRLETGARAALPMWIDYMRVALEDTPESVLPQPPGLVSVRIDADTGKPASSANPKAMFETFRKEYAPQADTQASEPGIGSGGNPYNEQAVPEQLF